MDVEKIEYVCSPVTVQNQFKNNPNCMHNLYSKNSLSKNESNYFVLMRTINLADNRKSVF